MLTDRIAHKLLLGACAKVRVLQPLLVAVVHDLLLGVLRELLPAWLVCGEHTHRVTEPQLINASLLVY